MNKYRFSYTMVSYFSLKRAIARAQAHRQTNLHRAGAMKAKYEARSTYPSPYPLLTSSVLCSRISQVQGQIYKQLTTNRPLLRLSGITL